MGKIFILKGADFSAHKVGDVNIDSPIPDEPIIKEEITITDFNEYLLDGIQNYYIDGDTNKWMSTNCLCVMINIEGYSKVIISSSTIGSTNNPSSVGDYKLYGNQFKLTANAFLKDKRIGNNDDIIGKRCDALQSNGVETEFDIPEGAKYLWCHVGEYKNSTNINPSFLTNKVQLIP